MPSNSSVSAARQDASVEVALGDGLMTVTGRLSGSSNVSFTGVVSAGDREIRCVYKPIRGERPLSDFPDGTLAGREVAAFLVSQAAGWDCVPPTVLRDGPMGPGMVQQWVADARPEVAASLSAESEVPDGWRPILTAQTDDGRLLVLSHADCSPLAVLAGFDVVVNNADRKVAHILPTADGRLRGVDHGLTFHSDPKLRTVLWGWAGLELDQDVTAGLQRLQAALPMGLSASLSTLITTTECDALAARIDGLLRVGHFPMPPQERTAIPWPPW